MGRQDTITRIGRVGILAGLAAFLAFGLMQGALVGGTVGIETGTYVFGPAAAGGLGLRVLAGIGMVTGAAISCAMFMTCGLAAGRVAGALLGAARTVKAGSANTASTR